MKDLEEKLGYHFQDRALLEHAMTHSSYANEHRAMGITSNERLEFLGDSVLGMVVAQWLFCAHPSMPEGELTRTRAALVCEDSLYEVARVLDLGRYLKLGRGEDAGGGRTRPSILADATEAMLAAVFLDGGLDPAAAIIRTFILDKERENQKIEAVKALTHNDFNGHGVEELYKQIMGISRKLQYQLMEEKALGRLPFIMVDELEKKNVRVVYQGVEGAYAQQAMFAFFGEDVNHFHVERWRDAMDAIAEGMADYAVLPIENSTAGIVNDSYDLLEEYDNYIVGEQIISVQHALLGMPDAEISDIKTVFSHPQGLMQCAKYLDEHRDWKQISVLNTAVAAKKVADEKNKEQAAIASTLAAKQQGLKVLDQGINRSEHNSTRFVIVTNQPIFRKDAEKVSICFEVTHESGCLYNVLSHFIFNNLNLCRIESRPIPDRNWEYHFFVDFEGNLNDSAVKNALRGIREEALNMKILGNY